MNIAAKWIWRNQPDYNLYNQTLLFKRTFFIDKEIKSAEILITADSFYRLYLNGQWLNDGPGRAYPKHYKYDRLDISPWLRLGKNKILVVAQYFGCGTFHQICQQGGFLAELKFEYIDGESRTLISDHHWKVSEAPQWLAAVPRIQCQMEGVEFYDAKLETAIFFEQAKELFSVSEAPWQDLKPRDCGFLTKKPTSLERFIRADLTKNSNIELAIPVQRILYPGLIDINNNISLASGIAFVINNRKLDKIRISSNDYMLTVNGKTSEDSWFDLNPGRNFVLALNKSIFNHIPEKTLSITPCNGFKLLNPMDAKITWPCFLRFPNLLKIKNDQTARQFDPQLLSFEKEVNSFYKKLVSTVVSEATFFKHLAMYAEIIPEECTLPSNFFLPNEQHTNASKLVFGPNKLFYDDTAHTEIYPSSEGDIQLIYDLGKQNIGYYDFELNATEGTIIDIFGVEHIFKNGQLQKTYANRNGMRYICKSGLNRFTSLKRRSGRYLIMVIRCQTAPVKIRKFQLIESTYPVEYQGTFRCSNEFMNKLWEISVHTLKLCMEDTFTDCPLYEQTLWTGDARNEALYAYPVFGAWDLSKRCIRLASQSLELLPLVGSQVPSCWDTLIPIWSFLWNISVWDYYFETAESSFLYEMWNPIVKNLAEAEKRIDLETGLFSSPTWNLFDWSGTDINHRTVIHNNMFYIGALRAAEKCAKVLGKKQMENKWKNLRRNLIKTINQYLDREKQAWPDALDDETKMPVSTVSVHNCFLSILYGVTKTSNWDNIKPNIVFPPKEMIKVGSPFAIQYLYETFEKLDMQEKILENFINAYRPMLKEGATTVWEVFINARTHKLTRSHCHAWSSSPVYFLGRIVLGIKMTEPGGTAFDISPQICGFDWADGSRATIHGTVKISWKKKSGVLEIIASGPKNVKFRYVPNVSHINLNIIFNGHPMELDAKSFPQSVKKVEQLCY